MIKNGIKNGDPLLKYTVYRMLEAINLNDMLSPPANATMTDSEAGMSQELLNASPDSRFYAGGTFNSP